MRQETKDHFLVGTVILGFLSIFKKSQASSLLKPWIPWASRGIKVMWFPLSRWGGELWLSLGFPQGIQTSLHLVRCNTSLNLSHCREVRPSFSSGSLGVHSTSDRKHRVPLTYLLLRENSTWGAFGKLSQIFNQRQGISSHHGTIWGAWSFTRVAVLILIFLYTWDMWLRESLSIPQRSQAPFTVCCGTRDSYGANEGEMGFILCWFRLLRAILHSLVDIRVHLVLWQCSWGLSGVLSRKSRLLPCLIRNTILLCTKCREIKPHLPARGMCHVISWFAAGTWCIFSGYSGDAHSKFHFVQRSQYSCLVTMDTSRI